MRIVVTGEKKAQEKRNQIRAAVQLHIDATAQQRQYDTGVNCASYKDSTVPAWASEAVAFIAWRDAVWSTVFNRLQEVESGLAPVPSTPQDVIDLLPEMDWP